MIWAHYVFKVKVGAHVYLQKVSLIDPSPCIFFPSIWQNINELLCKYRCTIANLERQIKSPKQLNHVTAPWCLCDSWIVISSDTNLYIINLSELIHKAWYECQKWLNSKEKKLSKDAQSINLNNYHDNKKCKNKTLANSPAPMQPQPHTDQNQKINLQVLQFSDPSVEALKSYQYLHHSNKKKDWNFKEFHHLKNIKKTQKLNQKYRNSLKKNDKKAYPLGDCITRESQSNTTIVTASLRLQP